MSSPFKLVYSPQYQVDIGSHVFPTNKYFLIYNRLLEEGIFSKKDFIFPEPAKEEDLLLVHTDDYVSKLLEGKLSTNDIMRLELPFSQELVSGSRICVEGTIQSCRLAVKDGAGIHIGGGFHHAYPDHGEGFCVFNDIAIGIRKVQQEALIERALVVDCDLHQGNGTAFIFAKDNSVFTFSIHQENNYPAQKPPSDMDIGLADGAGDEEYLKNLNEHIPGIIEEFKPELVFYVAGADPYQNDQLGGLSLTQKGLRLRDELILNLCRSNNIPLAAALAGGYAIDVEDTVTIHCNMIKTAKEVWG